MRNQKHRRFPRALWSAAGVAATLSLIGAATAWSGSTPSTEKAPTSQVRIAGRAYPAGMWTGNDLLSGREDVFAPMRARIMAGAVKLTHGAIKRAAGTMDIGEIAVIEDDGTLVSGNVTNSTNILNAFYATHTDEYDIPVIFVASTFPGNIQPEAGFAFFQNFAGFVAGVNTFQGNPQEAGGFSRLTGMMNMNDLPEYPASFNTDFLNGVASGAEILGQETEHYVGAFLQPDNGVDILGRSNAHWSFYLNHPGVGNASPMEGNRWQDNGNGTFTTVESFTGFAELDEYLMGFRAAATVSPMFVITPQNLTDSTFPATGVTQAGVANTVTIQNIINANGVRMPDTTTSVKTLKDPFILVIPQGTTASAADIAKIDSFRLAWEVFFNTSTEGLGSMDTTLAAGPVTALPFADMFNGAAPDQTNWIWTQGATISTLAMNPPSGGRALELNGDWGGGDEVRSRVLDLSGQAPGATFANYSVERTGGGSSPIANENLLVEYFNNASTWVTLRTFASGGPDESVFTFFSDALPVDALHTNFRIRFRRLQGRIGAFGDYFVDDVSVGAAAAPCIGDINGDGAVGSSDLAILLGQWSTANPGADLDNNGAVGSSDLAIMLGRWGPCP